MKILFVCLFFLFPVISSANQDNGNFKIRLSSLRDEVQVAFSKLEQDVSMFLNVVSSRTDNCTNVEDIVSQVDTVKYTVLNDAVALVKVAKDASIVAKEFSKKYPNFNNWTVEDYVIESVDEAINNAKKRAKNKYWNIRHMEQNWFEDRYDFWAVYFSRDLNMIKKIIDYKFKNGAIIPSEFPPILDNLSNKCQDLSWLIGENISKIDEYFSIVQKQQAME